MIDNIQEYDHRLLTRISFDLTLWKCNTCHKIFKTEKGCYTHAIKEKREIEKQNQEDAQTF